MYHLYTSFYFLSKNNTMTCILHFMSFNWEKKKITLNLSETYTLSHYLLKTKLTKIEQQYTLKVYYSQEIYFIGLEYV